MGSKMRSIKHLRRCTVAGLAVVVVASFIVAETRPAGNTSTGFFVKNGLLYDANGNLFVARGCNNSHGWNDGDRKAYNALDNIAAFGFNSVRIVWGKSSWSFVTSDDNANERTIMRPPANSLFPIMTVLLAALSAQAWDWENCQGYTTKQYGMYFLRNNTWGTSTPQCIKANSEKHWRVEAHHSGGSNVKCYPQCARGWVVGNGYVLDRSVHKMGVQVKDLRKAMIHCTMTDITSGRCWALWDIYLHNTPTPGGEKAQTSFMVHQLGNDPWIRSLMSKAVGNGQVATIGGLKFCWSLHKESWATRHTIRVFCMPNDEGDHFGVTSMTMDLKAFLDYFVDKGYISATEDYLTSIQVGWEIIEGGTYEITDFWTALQDEPNGDGTATEGKMRLTVNTVGSGSIVREPSGSLLDSGATVTLTAQPDARSLFDGWSGDASGTNREVAITMDTDKEVTATFVADPDAPLITNGDFSSGTDGWTWYEFGSGDGTFSVVNGWANVAITAPGAEAWHVQLYQGGFQLRQGQSYVLAFDASADAPRPIEIRIDHNGNPWTIYHQEEVQLSQDKQRFTVPFTMDSTTDDNVRVEFNLGIESADVAIDNVSLSVADPTAAARYAACPKQFTPHVRLDSWGRVVVKGVRGTWALDLFDASGRILTRATGKGNGVVDAAANAPGVGAVFIRLRSGGHEAVIASAAINGRTR